MLRGFDAVCGVCVVLSESGLSPRATSCYCSARGNPALVVKRERDLYVSEGHGGSVPHRNLNVSRAVQAAKTRQPRLYLGEKISSVVLCQFLEKGIL